MTIQMQLFSLPILHEYFQQVCHEHSLCRQVNLSEKNEKINISYLRHNTSNQHFEFLIKVTCGCLQKNLIIFDLLIMNDNLIYASRKDGIILATIFINFNLFSKSSFVLIL